MIEYIVGETGKSTVFPSVTAVITHRKGGDYELPLTTLQAQVYPRSFKIIVVEDTNGEGQSAVKNRGIDMVDTDMVLFSDSDINWSHDALILLASALVIHPECDYSYGSYLRLENGNSCTECKS